MGKEDKELLLKDLCARLPYGVKCNYNYNNEIYNIDYISALYEEVKLDIPNNYTIGISEVKPYLRPMSSMTEEERVEYFYNRMTSWAQNEFGESYTEAVMQYRIDFLLEHHFDYRGLIEKGLALEAPEGMYLY